VLAQSPVDCGRPAAPAMLLHGFTVSADLNSFAAYASLAGSYRVIALDLRGQGRRMRSAERSPWRIAPTPPPRCWAGSAPDA
jgi:pimeloyl-ACP methyl ester carboxylesterase